MIKNFAYISVCIDCEWNVVECDYHIFFLTIYAVFNGFNEPK